MEVINFGFMYKDLIKIYHKESSPILKPYIKKISVLKSEGELSYLQKLTPSPYNYLSYNEKDIPTSIFLNQIIKPSDRLMIAGIKTEKIYVKYEGILLQLLFEFTASGFYYLFRISPVIYRNNLIPFRKIINNENIIYWLSKLYNNGGIDEKINVIESLLISRISNALKPIDYIEKCFELIEKNHGCLHIKDIADEVGVSERQLDRKFREVVGLTPKKFSRLLQLHYIIHLIMQENFNLQDIVFKSYFFDRPHLTHTFKELTGVTPMEFIHSDNRIASKYFTSD